MSEPSLFDAEPYYAPPPEPQPDPYEGMGQDARRTARRLDMLRAGTHPVTKRPLHDDAAPVDDRDAPGLRCDTCAMCETFDYHRRTYVKCLAVELTHGPGSDTRRWYPACVAYTVEAGGA